MKTKTWSFFIFAILALLIVTACGGSQAGPGSVVGNGQSGIPPHGDQAQKEGLSNFQNATLGVQFDYPLAWEVQTSSDQTKVTVSNRSRVAKVDEVSEMIFEQVNDVEGVPVHSQAELEKTLGEKFPLKKWEKAVLKNQCNGFILSEQWDKRREWTVYVLDSKQKLIRVHGWGHSAGDGQGACDQILKSFLTG